MTDRDRIIRYGLSPDELDMLMLAGFIPPPLVKLTPIENLHIPPRLAGTSAELRAAQRKKERRYRLRHREDKVKHCVKYCPIHRRYREDRK